MGKIENVDVVARDNRKKDLRQWVLWNCRTPIHHNRACTGTTGSLIEQALQKVRDCGDERVSQPVGMIGLKSAPFGGDRQMGAMITPRGRSIR